MIKIEQRDNNLAVIQLSGDITESEIELAKKQITSILDSGNHLSVLMDFREFDRITAGAIKEDLKGGLSMLGKLGLIDRCAMLTDKTWIALLSTIEGAIIPGLEIKNFRSSEVQLAEDWLIAGIKRDREKAIEHAYNPANPALRILPIDEEGVVAFEINGYITTQDINNVMPFFEQEFQKNDQLLLFNRLISFKGFDPKILKMPELIALKKDGLKATRRYAIVSSLDWVETLVKPLNWIFKADIKTFKLEKENEAWFWLNSETTSN